MVRTREDEHPLPDDPEHEARLKLREGADLPPWLQRYEAFRSVRIPHERLTEAKVEIIRRIDFLNDSRDLAERAIMAEGARRARMHEQGALILVFGPTNAGKTTLLDLLCEHYEEEALATPDWDVGRLPIVAVQAVVHLSQKFDILDFWQRVLVAMDEPLIARKVLLDGGDEAELAQGRRMEFIRGRYKNERALRRAVEQGLLFRRPAALLIDEGHHMALQTSELSERGLVEALKTLADISRVPLVLFGTHELVRLRNRSSQIIARSYEFDLPRYRLDVAGDVEEFKKILRSLQATLPFESVPAMEADWKYYYRGCLGCIGVLKKWFNRTTYAALKAGKTRLTKSDFGRHRLSEDLLREMLNEIKEGERKLEEARKKSRKDLNELLGFPEYERRQDKENALDGKKNQEQESVNTAADQPPALARRVGRPKARRYPTGGDEQCS
jgi:GTPase SAR1 family protein